MGGCLAWLAWGGGAGVAYVEGFTLVVEEHVWSLLAIPACAVPARHVRTQGNHAQSGRDAARAVGERHGARKGGVVAGARWTGEVARMELLRDGSRRPGGRGR